MISIDLIFVKLSVETLPIVPGVPPATILNHQFRRNWWFFIDANDVDDDENNDDADDADDDENADDADDDENADDADDDEVTEANGFSKLSKITHI